MKVWCDVTCDRGVTSITVTVTQSYNIEKDIESSRTDNVLGTLSSFFVLLNIKVVFYLYSKA